MPRPLDGNNDALARKDRGAFEYVHVLADTDLDNLLDALELSDWGTNPTRDDTDGDGVTDGEEIVTGTNPLDWSDYFSVFHFDPEQQEESAGKFVVSWLGRTGRLYSLMLTTNLTAGWSFAPGQAGRPGTGALQSYTNREEDSGAFFRVLVRPEE